MRNTVAHSSECRRPFRNCIVSIRITDGCRAEHRKVDPEQTDFQSKVQQPDDSFCLEAAIPAEAGPSPGQYQAGGRLVPRKTGFPLPRE